jgi:hypothetical protein
MPTLDYKITVRTHRKHRLIATHLAEAIERGAIADAEDRAEAEELIYAAVLELLRRKRISDDESEELRGRFKDYL